MHSERFRTLPSAWSCDTMARAARHVASQPQSGKSAGLLRQLGFISATAIVVSNMIGTGIFS